MNKKLEMLFKNKYGYSDKNCQEIAKKITISNEDIINSRMNFYKKQFSLTDKQLADVISSFPALLGYSEKSIEDKCDFLSKELNIETKQLASLLLSAPSIFGLKDVALSGKITSLKQNLNLSKEDLTKKILQRPNLLTLSSEKLNEKVNLMQSTLNLSDEKFDKSKTKLSVLLGRNNQSILKNIDFYKQHLSLPNQKEEKFGIILISNPNLLNFSQEYVLDKIEFLKKTFSLSQEDVSLIFNSFPSIIYTEKHTLIDKGNFIKSLFNASDDEFKQIILKHSKIFGYDKAKLSAKVKNFEKVGIDKSLIIKSPILLSAPVDKIGIRLAIGQHFNVPLEDFVKHKLFIINENSLYAKLKYFSSIDNDEPNIIKWLGRSDFDFARHFHITGKQLLEFFPLHDNVKEEIMTNYQNKNVDNVFDDEKC